MLNGDLGVSPGTSLVGFGLPAVVNGATHNNDAVAANAQADLTTAYDVAAGQPVAPANDLTGTNLGNRTLTAGAYRYSSSAQLTGPLTLDAQGDPNAQFVFEIGSTLTTAAASSVVLINGASPCNVYWQVGSSATLGTTTAFQGNLMALTEHLAEQRRDGDRAPARPQRLGQPDQQRPQPAHCAATTTPAAAVRAARGGDSAGRRTAAHPATAPAATAATAATATRPADAGAEARPQRQGDAPACAARRPARPGSARRSAAA